MLRTYSLNKLKRSHVATFWGANPGRYTADVLVKMTPQKMCEIVVVKFSGAYPFDTSHFLEALSGLRKHLINDKSSDRSSRVSQSYSLFLDCDRRCYSSSATFWSRRAGSTWFGMCRSGPRRRGGNHHDFATAVGEWLDLDSSILGGWSNTWNSWRVVMVGAASSANRCSVHDIGGKSTWFSWVFIPILSCKCRLYPPQSPMFFV